MLVAKSNIENVKLKGEFSVTLAGETEFKQLNDGVVTWIGGEVVLNELLKKRTRLENFICINC